MGLEWVDREIKDAERLGQEAMLMRLHKAGEISDEILDRELLRLRVDPPVPLKVIEFDRNQHKIVLSVVAYYKKRERAEHDEYLAQHPTTTTKSVAEAMPEELKVEPEATPDAAAADEPAAEAAEEPAAEAPAEEAPESVETEEKEAAKAVEPAASTEEPAAPPEEQPSDEAKPDEDEEKTE